MVFGRDIGRLYWGVSLRFFINKFRLGEVSKGDSSGVKFLELIVNFIDFL